MLNAKWNRGKHAFESTFTQRGLGRYNGGERRNNNDIIEHKNDCTNEKRTSFAKVAMIALRYPSPPNKMMMITMAITTIAGIMTLSTSPKYSVSYPPGHTSTPSANTSPNYTDWRPWPISWQHPLNGTSKPYAMKPPHRHRGRLNYNSKSLHPHCNSGHRLRISPLPMLRCPSKYCSNVWIWTISFLCGMRSRWRGRCCWSQVSSVSWQFVQRFCDHCCFPCSGVMCTFRFCPSLMQQWENKLRIKIQQMLYT